MNILEINNLTLKLTGNQKILVDNLSFNLEKNTILGILGESGSGKSLTAFSITKLLPPAIEISSGRILFNDGKDIINLAALTNKELKKIRGGKISIIFQEPMTSFNPRIKLGKQVDEVLEIHKPELKPKDRKQKTLQLFTEVGISEPERIYKSYPFEVSGGQKQRVMIAMALAAQPSIVIADEPTTAIDITVQRKIINLLLKLKETHDLSIIFISHDIGVLANISDKLLVMYKGKKVEEGTVNQILHNPSSAYTKGLIACRPPIKSRPERLPVVSDYLQGIETQYPEKEINKSHILSSPQILNIKNLTVSYPEKGSFLSKAKRNTVLKDITLDIYQGETLGLVGESGSGKTTLGRTILKLIEPDSGDILYNGKSILTFSGKELKKYRKEVQLIFQDPFSSLNPRLTIGETIMEPMIVHKLYMRKETIAQTKTLMEQVGLPSSFFDRYPHELSGGQRQRVVIARSLAVKPKLIICDESVSALDVSLQAQILNLLNDLKDEFNLTYIFISHDIAVIKYFSDRIAVMRNGKIEETGFSDDIYFNPQSEYTANLWKSVYEIT